MSAGILILVAILLAPVLWFLLPFALRKMETRQLDATCKTKRAVVLSFDDGPTQSVSLPLLDLLARKKVSATFFAIGQQAEEQPEVIQRLHAEGHEIANHTRTHTNAWKVAPWTANRDIAAGRQSLAGLGVKTDLFRPPFGKTTLASLIFRLRNRLRFAYWTIDTQDSWDRRPVDDILDELDRKGGGVILMHDFGQPKRGPARSEHLEYVLTVTEAIIDFARSKDMQICRFGDLYHMPLAAEARP